MLIRSRLFVLNRTLLMVNSEGMSPSAKEKLLKVPLAVKTTVLLPLVVRVSTFDFVEPGIPSRSDSDGDPEIIVMSKSIVTTSVATPDTTAAAANPFDTVLIAVNPSPVPLFANVSNPKSVKFPGRFT